MSSFYVACDLGVDTGRVVLGNLLRGRLSISEVRRFSNSPVQEKEIVKWNIPELYQETLEGLKAIAAYEEPVDSISCHSWPGDYLLFDSEGSLISPAYHHSDTRTRAEMQKVLSKLGSEAIYAETGVQQMPLQTLFQLRAESFWRLSRARHLMPMADGFNYLLAGVPGFEMSLASTTQLYNPIKQNWSERLFDALHVPKKIFAPIVRAGTELGELRPDIAKETGLDQAMVVTSCSHEIAAAMAGLPVNPGERWAYLDIKSWALMGTEISKPIINETSHRLNFTNEPGYGGTIRFSKPAMGLWVLQECQKYWKERDREVDGELLTHLAGSATPFESLVNLSDPRFLEPGDMPVKIQAFCRDTNQPVPRKPGSIVRCILESMALLYRKTLREIEALTGGEITRLYVLGGKRNNLLTHFAANALQIPVVLVPEESASIGNLLVQALAMGHISSLEQARQVSSDSFKVETLVPYATAWNAAYDRLSKFPTSTQ